jgi:3-oxoacyl-[acyl-carrier-protein] synthase-3
VIGAAPAGVRVGITGLGASIPATALESAEIASRLDVSEDWIVERSGIRTRHVAADGETASGLAVTAARRAVAAAGVEPATLDFVLVATATPDLATPATAALVAGELGAARAAAYDLSAACTGFVYGLAQAYALIASGLAERGVVIGAEILSRAIDWSDRGTAILFGDGGGAAVVTRVREGGFLGFELGCDGSRAGDLELPHGGAIRMNGTGVYRFSTREVPESVERLLERCGVAIADVDLYVPHQANRRIVEHTLKRLGIPEEKAVLNIDRVGNTSAASIPIALVDAAADRRLADGGLVLMTGVGAGLTWGSALLRWGGAAA